MTVKREVKYLKDYKKTEYIISEIRLCFELDEKVTIVTNSMSIDGDGRSPLFLNGERMELVSVSINNKSLTVSEYILTDDDLIIKNPPSGKFELEIVNRISPIDNTELEGLYISGGNFFTQNEAEGFRRITYFTDRPDVMCRFECKIIADAERYPVLLSNGNLIETKIIDSGKKMVTWRDPVPKPCYLFALVAGDFGLIEDNFITMTDRTVKLQIYVDHGCEHQAFFAMSALKKAMRWDEERFGREYDLDLFMIVAVSDFNFGAMENKGLNIFNSRLILADIQTTTDERFERIESVVAHEYFHNWTGNRITCRDWFQLTLKEGLTVFRDQEFSADLGSRSVKRIKDVLELRSHQFPEDSGPMAHPIQPKSYMEINNFYTMTVYEKGSEVIRMLYTILGRDGFRAGMDKYFSLYDGQAVTTDDFIKAFELSSNIDFHQFRKWYDIAGTPVISVNENFNEDTASYEIVIKQSDEEFLIPISFALFDENGDNLIQKSKDDKLENTLVINKKEEKFVFNNIKRRPVLSILRNFSAPVKLDFNQSVEDLSFLLGNDSDGFNRWESGQKLFGHILTKEDCSNADCLDLLVNGLSKLLNDNRTEDSFKALAIKMPPYDNLLLEQTPIKFEETHDRYILLKKQIASRLKDQLLSLYTSLHSRKFNCMEDGRGARALKSSILSYLMSLEDESIYSICYDQQLHAANMTDELAAFSLLADSKSSLRTKAANHFYDKWSNNQLVLNSWLAVQSMSSQDDTLEIVKELKNHKSFVITNPNMSRSLLGGFAHNSLVFNRRDGAGYSFIADCIIELDKINPKTAAELSRGFNHFERLDKDRHILAANELERVVSFSNISNAVFEIIEKTLKQEKKND